MIVKLKDVVSRVNNNIDRFNTDIEYYLGKGHGECGEIAITERGNLKKDVGMLGFKFHFAFEPGDSLFFSRSFALRKAGMAMYTGICSDSTYILRTKDINVLLPDYLPAIIQSDVIWEYCDTHHTGGVNFLINWSTLADYEFELPTIAEQKVLADKLWAAYRLKESYKKLLVATQEMVKSQYIEMFGLPNNSKFPTRNLGAVCRIKSGTSFPIELERDKGDIPYSKVADMNLKGNEVYMRNASRYVDVEVAKDLYLPSGATIFPKRGAAIHTNKKRILVRNTCVDLNVIGVIPSGELDPIYLYWYFRCTNLSDISDNSGIPQINNKHLIPLSIGIPPMDLQQQFVEIANQADKSEFELRKSIESIDAVIKSLINS